jgi:hypothetical protein
MSTHHNNLSERGWLFRKGYPAWCRYAVIQSAISNYLIGCNWRSKLVLFVGHHVVLRHVLRQFLNIDIEQVGKAPSAQVAVAYEVGGLFTAPAGVFELQAVHESTKPPMVLARIMHHAAVFCTPGELTRADVPSGGIGVRQLGMQRVRG